MILLHQGYADHGKFVVILKLLLPLLGLRLGYTKHCCFLCMWDSRDRKSYYKKVEWPARNLKPGEKNVQNEPSVEPEIALIPPLHIKLGPMKNFVKAMDQEGEAECKML